MHIFRYTAVHCAEAMQHVSRHASKKGCQNDQPNAHQKEPHAFAAMVPEACAR
jgi:hypothetical protein